MNFFKKFFINFKKISFVILTKKDIVEFGHGLPLYFTRKIKNNYFQLNPYEKIYIVNVLKNYLKLKFDFYNYTISLIKDLNPKVIISFNDNNIYFYKLKKNFPNIKFISIQNGYRTQNRDFFEDLKKVSSNEKLECDYYCTWNKKISDELNKYITFKPKVIGSLRNNCVKKKKFKKNNSLLFISQYRRKIDNFDKTILANKENKNFWIEMKFLKIVSNYCNRKNINLDILGTSELNYQKEKSFFKEIILSNFNFIKKINDFSQSYKNIDKYDNIISVDSSLSYEAIGRNKKILIFNGRESKKNNLLLKDYYGFPKKISKNCKFIVNTLNQNIIEQKINYLIKTNYQTWKKDNIYYLKDLMIFDDNNKKIFKVIEECLR